MRERGEGDERGEKKKKKQGSTRIKIGYRTLDAGWESMYCEVGEKRWDERWRTDEELRKGMVGGEGKRQKGRHRVYNQLSGFISVDDHITLGQLFGLDGIEGVQVSSSFFS